MSLNVGKVNFGYGVSKAFSVNAVKNYQSNPTYRYTADAVKERELHPDVSNSDRGAAIDFLA